EAVDLMAAGMQKMSAEMRGELPEILHEYSTHFRNMGLSGSETMTLLVSMAQQGKFALDKTGDAVKEFSIRGSDMSKSSVEAYELIGLNAERMSSAIASGGAAAREAMRRTASGLLQIQDPAERANAAIALFGTPIEDLAVDQIPDFLRSLA
ncbi:phage tail tape measure protein, partial [Escherichia coli]